MTIEEAGLLLDKLAEELPAEFFGDLNGGVLLDPGEKRHPSSSSLCILGEYHTHPVLGRQIIIYYGSFARTYGGASPHTWEDELRRTLRHEFTHHIESLAGERTLERRDREQIEEFLGGYAQ